MPALTTILPQFYPAEWREEFSLVGVEFAPRVRVGVVEPVEGGYSFVTGPQLARIGMEFEELLSAAADNLAALNEGVDLHVAHPNDAVVSWITSQDNFAAVRMLLPSVKAKLTSLHGYHFLFTIPSRDLCLFWNSSAPPYLSEKHGREALEDFEASEYNLTPAILVYSEAWPCREFLGA